MRSVTTWHRVLFAALAAGIVAPPVPAAAQLATPFAGAWSVQPALEMDCTVDAYPLDLPGGMTLRGFTTNVKGRNRLIARPRLELDVVGVTLQTLEPELIIPLDPAAQTFGGMGTFALDTVAVPVAGLGTVLATATGSIHVAGRFSGADAFTANLALSVTPRFKIWNEWRAADCGAIDAAFTAARMP
jgi:hypothetical protein